MHFLSANRPARRLCAHHLPRRVSSPNTGAAGFACDGYSWWMSDDALRATRNTVDGMVLTESDLIGGDKIARQFAALRDDIATLSDDEPWLKEWLGREATKGGELFTIAKLNRAKKGSPGAPPPDSPTPPAAH